MRNKMLVLLVRKVLVHKILWLILILSGINTYSNVSAQNCKGFHKERICYSRTEKGFNYYGQSRSALFELDSTYTFDAILYGRKDFIINVCAELNVGPIHFKIIDKQTNSVLYDNMDDDYYESVGFTVDSPQEVRFELSVNPLDYSPEDFMDNRVCVGVLILWRKTTRFGF